MTTYYSLQIQGNLSTNYFIDLFWIERDAEIGSDFLANKTRVDIPELQGDYLLLTSIHDVLLTRIPWRAIGGFSPLKKEDWDSLEIQLIDLIKRTLLNASEKNANANPGDDVEVESKNGIVSIKLSSQKVEEIGKVTAVLYQILPNEVTGIAAFVAGGLVLLDDLGGNAGITVYSALPFPTHMLIVPNDPKQFVENAIAVFVNPKEQIEFAQRNWDTLAGLGGALGGTHPPGLANDLLSYAFKDVDDINIDKYLELMTFQSSVSKELLGEIGELLKNPGDFVPDLKSDLEKNYKDAVSDVGDILEDIFDW